MDSGEPRSPSPCCSNSNPPSGRQPLRVCAGFLLASSSDSHSRASSLPHLAFLFCLPSFLELRRLWLSPGPSGNALLPVENVEAMGVGWSLSFFLISKSSDTAPKRPVHLALCLPIRKKQAQDSNAHRFAAEANKTTLSGGQRRLLTSLR